MGKLHPSFDLPGKEADENSGILEVQARKAKEHHVSLFLVLSGLADGVVLCLRRWESIVVYVVVIAAVVNVDVMTCM